MWAQADLYLGHALFGLCLRRLARRFDLALSFEEQEEKDTEQPGGDAVFMATRGSWPNASRTLCLSKRTLAALASYSLL